MSAVCLIKHTAIKTYEVLTYAPDGGDWSASRPDRLNAEGRFLLSIREEVGWAAELVWAL